MEDRRFPDDFIEVYEPEDPPKLTLNRAKWINWASVLLLVPFAAKIALEDAWLAYGFMAVLFLWFCFMLSKLGSKDG